MERRALAVFGTVVLTFFSIIGIIVGMRFLGFEGFASEDYGPLTISTALLVLTVPILIVFSVQNFHLKEKLRFKEKSYFKRVTQGISLGLFLKGLSLFVSTVISPASFEFALKHVTFMEWLPYFMWFLFTLVLNSVNEEIVYRLFPVQNLPQFRPIMVVLSFAAIFSTMHFVVEPPETKMFFYRFFFGTFVGLLYVFTRSFCLIAGIHTGWNFVALIVGSSGWKTGTLIYMSGVGKDASITANVAVLAIATLGAVYYSRKSSLVV